MMVLVEKLRFYSGNVLDFLEKGIEILIATLFCFETNSNCYPADLPYYPWIIEYQLV